MKWVCTIIQDYDDEEFDDLSTIDDIEGVNFGYIDVWYRGKFQSRYNQNTKTYFVPAILPSCCMEVICFCNKRKEYFDKIYL